MTSAAPERHPAVAPPTVALAASTSSANCGCSLMRAVAARFLA